jgi:8-oxo-dGTP diphosphatase
MKLRATVICEQDRHVLLVRKAGNRWTLPGGKVEPGETAAEAAIRELHEETGLRVEGLVYVMVLESGGTRHYVYEVSVQNLHQVRPHNEIVDCIWHPLETVHNLDVSEATLTIVKAFLRRL